MPATASVALLLVGLTVMRFVLVRGGHGFDPLINATAGFAAAGYIFGEPSIAGQFAAIVPGGRPTMIDLWHWSRVLAFACGLGIALRHNNGQAHYKTRFRLGIAFAVMAGVVFFAMSSPGRSAGISIVEIGGWRYGVYGGTYWALPVVVASYMMKAAMTAWHRTAMARERAVVVLVIFFAIGTLLNAVVFALAELSAAISANTEFSRATQSFASSEFDEWGPRQALFAASLSLVLVPSLVRATAQTLRLDRDSRIARRLYPVWRDLTAAAPDVVLPLKWADRWGASPAERLHRRRVEIHDAAEIVARFVRPLPTDIDASIEATIDENDQEHFRTVTELFVTARRLADDGNAADPPTTYRANVPGEQTLIRLWEPARSLATSTESPTNSVAQLANNANV